jgi:hypothetical protein
MREAAGAQQVVKGGDVSPARQENENCTVIASVAYELNDSKHELQVDIARCSAR